MKLLTHNLLQSPGTRHGYPLAIEAEKVETVETEFNPDFLVRMVEKLDYPGLVTTIATVRHRHTLPRGPGTHSRSVRATPGRIAALTAPPRSRPQLGMQESLPAAVPANFGEDESFLKALHHVLLEVEIVDGHLICPETGKRFPVKDGIPSML